ncbi:hypothetical protein PN36_06870 [Candidatus Thiomargarita nelsonii]|uniref:Leucine-rich repeat-containing N-terminal plant-type domain-containing protein n=1 Tax=Candidatus Thiomargarita nelsonii TaxID=1003181 RepID=A0A4E0QS27_9GAMM|nr:hypothetical protein PN36_06870 [Candidatus Thiomargarita nelsonii]
MTPSPGDSRYRLLADKVSVMNEANLHWAFWTFRWYGNPQAGYSSLYLDDQLDEPLAEILRVNNDSTFNCKQVTEIQKNECQALIALYESTDGANWENNTGWNVTNTPCSWNGVTCQGKHVTRLSLGNNSLKGSISAKFLKLKNLESLKLSDNELNGTSLKKFKKLKSLKTLWLNNCKLSGKIPNSLMKLKKLTGLDLNDNCLKTKVSKKLGKWLDEINPGWDETQTDCLY